MMSINCAWFLLNFASFKQQKWPDLTKYNCITKSELENYEIFMARYYVTNPDVTHSSYVTQWYFVPRNIIVNCTCYTIVWHYSVMLRYYVTCLYPPLGILFSNCGYHKQIKVAHPRRQITKNWDLLSFKISLFWRTDCCQGFFQELTRFLLKETEKGINLLKLFSIPTWISSNYQ